MYVIILSGFIIIFFRILYWIIIERRFLRSLFILVFLNGWRCYLVNLFECLINWMWCFWNIINWFMMSVFLNYFVKSFMKCIYCWLEFMKLWNRIMFLIWWLCCYFFCMNGLRRINLYVFFFYYLDGGRCWICGRSIEMVVNMGFDGSEDWGINGVEKGGF